MKLNLPIILYLKTTRCRWLTVQVFCLFALFLASCSSAPKAETKPEVPTEFTEPYIIGVC